MIIDCFTFFNELDLLEIRLNELYPSIDKFVLVEAELTQSLLPKPFYFEQNKHRYSKFLDKIVHVKMMAGECPSNEQNLWSMENAQRNKISDGVTSCNPSDDSIILISDLDEIPKADIVRKLPSVFNEHDLHACSLEMGFFAYFLNLRATSREWIGTVACKKSSFSQSNPQYFRAVKDSLPAIPNAGWHFSWLGGYEKVYEKTFSCIEPFDKSKLPTLEEFKEFFENFKKSDKKFFIHLENLQKKETEFSKIPINESFPKYLLENKEKYSNISL
jgi:beta-1,4-mannosyl-glycoprotein beta-1,4-N-acetylglucosaminyltransferase